MKIKKSLLPAFVSLVLVACGGSSEESAVTDTTTTDSTVATTVADATTDTTMADMGSDTTMADMGSDTTMADTTASTMPGQGAPSNDPLVEEFCTRFKEFGEDNSFAGATEPAEVEAGFDNLVEMAGNMVDAAPAEIETELEQFETTITDLRSLAEESGWDQTNVDIEEMTSLQESMTDAMTTIGIFAGTNCI